MTPARFTQDARREVSRLTRDLESLFARVDQLDDADELTADVSRYICVRLAGFLEQSLAACGRSLCSQHSFGPGQNFALSWLKRTSNPRADEIVKFVQRFNDDWAADLQKLLDVDERGQRINALLGIRNDIAHGKSQGASKMRAREYYLVVGQVVEFLLDKFEPLPTAGATAA